MMNTTRTHEAWLPIFTALSLCLAACGDDGSGGSGAGDTGGAGGSGANDTDGSAGAPAGSGGDAAGGGGADAALTPADLAGSWSSSTCEAYPNGMGGNNYLTRAFTFSGATWTLDLDLFGDDACSFPIFSVAIEGPFTLGALSSVVAGATEGEFAFVENVWTAHDQGLADTFTGAGCGSAPWEVGVPQDVSATGCIGVAHPVDDCPQEYDLVSFQGDQLFFGARVTDLCTEEGRPTMLAPFGLTKQP
jgi:hypothetical protein